MRIIVDYRPALRARSGVGGYLHDLMRAYATSFDDALTAFVSSWKDRPDPELASALGARVVDRRIPVRLLNTLWHRLELPPVEWLAGEADVAHSPHPLLMPARRAAQVVTIHDLYILDAPEHHAAEVRRDYPGLIAAHARRADAVITNSLHTRQGIVSRLGVPEERVYCCPPGAPSWQTLGRQPHVPSPDDHVLFMGTIEPRKNIGTLLDAYERLLDRMTPLPLVLAGRPGSDSDRHLARMARPPLGGHVTHLGYVSAEERERLLSSARAVLLPSLDEGFGLPALEAMSAGVPVIASNRGALPEVLGEAGALVDPLDPEALAQAMARVMSDEAWARAAGARGLARAATFQWSASVSTLRRAYLDAVERRRAR